MVFSPLVPEAPAVAAVVDAALADVFMALTAAAVAAAPKAAERTVRREMPLASVLLIALLMETLLLPCGHTAVKYLAFKSCATYVDLCRYRLDRAQYLYRSRAIVNVLRLYRERFILRA
ncbi:MULTISPECIES: hypothetical protein [unclassified Ensifer]|uniref:hypothetical protein n=1 Tax=unclassified Ensifer TaxID=2633371 RepID=UPI000712366E|nr:MULTISPECIES: hypothetical protein [unclassified Ensifer]KQX23707.1 hypothetical protein ASD01_28015 [Ensifer sp. Root423]KQZ56648.1 hypothetical protein ASD63_24155 [Ensifer sp. Root558]